MDGPVTPFDFARMIWGDQPPLFYAEILVRTIVIYLYTLALIRWIGGRGIAQMSLVEFFLVIALGSAVGDAFFYPNVPLLHAMLVITLVVIFDKVIDWLILRFSVAKRVVDGSPITLVRDGRLVQSGLSRHSVGAAEVMAMLRIRGIRNLGEVDYAFLEVGGGMSVFRRLDPKPGLTLVPPPELDEYDHIRDPSEAEGGMACCVGCGAVAEARSVLPDRPCPECDGNDWTQARLSPGVANNGPGCD
jgi:uncharacterized membrane protein YcaP (DUF421 family)